MVVKVRNAEGETFAMKRIVKPDRESMDESLYKRRVNAQVRAFRKEFENQQSLSVLKGFPKVYGYGMVGEDPLIIMEWVEGRTLSKATELRSADPAGAKVAPLVVAQLGAAVYSLISTFEYLDDSFAHRDISPNNIMLCEDEASIENQMESGHYDLRLIDFGSATKLAHFDDPTFTTVAGVIRKATPEYAPPEMLTNDLPGSDHLRQSPLIDVYAIGSVLYELMCGEAPYRLAKLQTTPQSYYRYKLDHSVPQPVSLHAGLTSIRAMSADPGIGPALERALSQGNFDQRRFIEAVNVVDVQLGFILMKSLHIDQSRRAQAWEMKDMLQRFVKNYEENILRFYNGQSLIPFIDVDAVPKRPQRLTSLGGSQRENVVLRPSVAPERASVSPSVEEPRMHIQPEEGGRFAGLAGSRICAIGSCAVIVVVAVLFSLMAHGQPGTLNLFGKLFAGSVPLPLCLLGCLFPVAASVPFYWLGSNAGQKMFAGFSVMVLLDLVVWALVHSTSWVSPAVEPMWALALLIIVLAASIGAWLVLGSEEDE